MKTLFVFCSVFIFTSDLISALTQADFPAPGACGTQIKERIIGGEETSIVDYPWYALLYYPKANETRINIRNFQCGGVLINKNYVLTAAHCIQTRNEGKPTFVRLGEHDLRTPQDCENGVCADQPQNVLISEWKVHEQYRRTSPSKPNDIALLRLQRDIETTDWIRPICLPFRPNVKNKNLDGISLIVAGFGRTRRGRNSNALLKLEIEGYNFNRCSEIYRTKYRAAINTKQLCAGGVPGQDSCSGDSGGPLMGEVLTLGQNTPPYTYVAGIVSFGPVKCATPGVPGVYTRVDQYLDWILNNMKP